MKKLMSLFLILLLGNISVSATIQMRDKLIYNGKEYKLDNTYFEPYFQKNPEKRPQFRTTALWRGYVATFEIEDNQLFVINIEKEADDENGKLTMKSIFNEIFPNSKKVKVDWFSGIFEGAYNEKSNYYNSFEHDYYSLFEIKDGNILKGKEFIKKEYNKFKKQQTKAFEKSETYPKCITKLKEQHSVQINEMTEYAQQVGDTNSAKNYAATKELSDKEAKKIINNRIFDFITEFIE